MAKVYVICATEREDDCEKIVDDSLIYDATYLRLLLNRSNVRHLRNKVTRNHTLKRKALKAKSDKIRFHVNRNRTK